MNNKPRIILISSIFPNSAEPTKGIYIYNIAENLSNYCDIKIIAPVPYFPRWLKSKKYGQYSLIESSRKAKELEVYHPRIAIPPKVGRSAYGLIYAIFLLRSFKRLIRSHNPDLILCYWVYPDGFAAAILSRLFRKHLILGARGCDVNEQTKPFTKRLLLRWAINRSRLTLSVSEDMKKNIMRVGVQASRIRVIPNGIGNGFRPVSAPSEGDDTILYCGRLSDEKGIQYLVEAAKILDARDVSFRVKLIGDGPLRPILSKRIDAYGLTDKFEFKGEISHEAIPLIMASSSLLCLPSIREGWPNVVMEALACGCPVVASDVGGVPEIVSKPGLGILVPSRDPEALARALQEGLRRKWDRDMISGHIRSRTWDKVAHEVYREIDRVIKQNSNGAGQRGRQVKWTIQK